MTTHAGESHLVMFLKMLIFSVSDVMNLHFLRQILKCLQAAPTPNQCKTIMGDIPHEKLLFGAVTFSAGCRLSFFI